eukprot:749679-Hanusia_phi.AAC.2
MVRNCCCSHSPLSGSWTNKTSATQPISLLPSTSAQENSEFCSEWSDSSRDVGCEHHQRSAGQNTQETLLSSLFNNSSSSSSV